MPTVTLSLTINTDYTKPKYKNTITDTTGLCQEWGSTMCTNYTSIKGHHLYTMADEADQDQPSNNGTFRVRWLYTVLEAQHDGHTCQKEGKQKQSTWYATSTYEHLLDQGTFPDHNFQKQLWAQEPVWLLRLGSESISYQMMVYWKLPSSHTHMHTHTQLWREKKIGIPHRKFLKSSHYASSSTHSGTDRKGKSKHCHLVVDTQNNVEEELVFIWHTVTALRHGRFHPSAWTQNDSWWVEHVEAAQVFLYRQDCRTLTRFFFAATHTLHHLLSSPSLFPSLPPTLLPSFLPPSLPPSHPPPVSVCLYEGLSHHSVYSFFCFNFLILCTGIYSVNNVDGTWSVNGDLDIIKLRLFVIH